MKTKTLFIFLLVAFFSFELNAQANFSVSGAIVDSTATPLPGATVVLLEQQDSTLHAFGITNQKGAYEIKGIKSGNFILQVTFLGYTPLFKPIEIIDQNLDLGHLLLFSEASLLSEVTVKAEHVPIVINGDTIQYNAAAFKTKPNAVVEDLLKKLPGVEVERDGTVRAQGEVVQNVLVDGKEFFGNDTRIATRNLPADAVEKVEVFDKKSDMAEFSGIDDGQEEKTINLELKDGKKQGYFGKLTGGYGTDQRYNAKGNINRFSKKMQWSTIGMLNNINEQGFSLSEYFNFMGGLGNMMSGGSGTTSLTLNPEDMGLPVNFGNTPRGIINTGAIGTNLNYEFSKKTELNGSYFYSKIKNINDRILNRQNFIGNDIYDYSEVGQSIVKNKNHRLNLKLEHEIDSFSNLILRTNLGFHDVNRNSNKTSKTLNTNNALENTGDQIYRADGGNIRLNSSLTFRHRFRKIGRFFSANVGIGNNQERQEGFVNSFNEFYNDMPSIDSLQQEQQLENDQLNYSGQVSYTEPIGKSKYLEFNYAYQNYSNQLTKTFYDQYSNERIFNAQLSNQYEQDYRYNRGGINFRWNKNKFNFTTGIRLQHSALKGVIDGLAEPIKKDFTNLLPSLDWQYNFTHSKNIALTYQTEVQQPTLQQLQPIVDNSDPLNIYIGNPDLEASYLHNVALRFMSYDQFNFTSLFGSLNLRYTQDRITNAQVIDEAFRQTLTPTNVKDDIFLRGNLSFGTPIRPIKSRINLDWNTVYNRNRVLVNEIENTNQLFTHMIDFSIENRKKDIIDVILGTRLSYNISKYSHDKNLNQSYLNHSYYADFILSPGKGWTINSAFDYDIYSAENFGDRQTIPLWRAGISKLILKDRLEIKLSAFDLLNKNTGIHRQSQGNFTQEEQLRTIGRYVMLSATYSLRGLGNDKGAIQVQPSRR